ncbi:MAG: sugar phosphate isomerase/epimerase [Acidobacteria bacterium]|nr:sugar phosphate isomerase/epimerase [Acidobacteriota bacterium]MBI3657168.1 sugar phosphate isomerase/epimerase [Acidobacteriota bacterium]
MRRDFLNVLAGGTLGALSYTQEFLAAPAARATGDVSLKKAVLLSMLPKQMSYNDRFKLAMDVGFDGIEVSTQADANEADLIKAASVKTGLRIHSVMNSDHWRYPLSSNDPSVVARSMKGMETSLRNAKLWGADTVLLVPAVVNAKTPYRDAYTRSQAQIRALIPLAKELEIIIAVEEVWNKFLLSPLEFVQYIDAFNSPWVKAYFDVGNVVLYGFPQDWIRTLGARIVKFHLKDFHNATNQFVGLLEGSVDWLEVRKAIGEIGFKGYLTVELKSGDEHYLRDVVKQVDKIFAG